MTAQTVETIIAGLVPLLTAIGALLHSVQTRKSLPK